ncbi:hypothetical protein A8B75_03550 [Sphingomonadales bacterium EhC05]|nr:hypothetical protein A8B75_03550 [Sphingomonadales bacterium EhC05]
MFRVTVRGKFRAVKFDPSLSWEQTRRSVGEPAAFRMSAIGIFELNVNGRNWGVCGTSALNWTVGWTRASIHKRSTLGFKLLSAAFL